MPAIKHGPRQKKPFPRNALFPSVYRSMSCGNPIEICGNLRIFGDGNSYKNDYSELNIEFQLDKEGSVVNTSK